MWLSSALIEKSLKSQPLNGDCVCIYVPTHACTYIHTQCTVTLMCSVFHMCVFTQSTHVLHEHMHELLMCLQMER